MKPDLSESLVLLESISDQHLYTSLIAQLNKDFMLAGIGESFDQDLSPQKLVTEVRSSIHDLIRDDFNDFLNLLYVVDISEYKVRQLDTSKPEILADEITPILLKRLWKKVWLKNKLS